MFGYERGDLDGKNVSTLMPRPFSERHDSYLSNYLTTGNAKILNSERSVVALRKVCTVSGCTYTTCLPCNRILRSMRRRVVRSACIASEQGVFNESGWVVWCRIAPCSPSH